MKKHPGRYCRQCNPRADEYPPEHLDETKGDDSDTQSSESEVNLSEEEAELSESWSQGSDGSSIPSPRYSDL